MAMTAASEMNPGQLRHALDEPFALTPQQIEFYGENGYNKLKDVPCLDLLEHYPRIIRSHVTGFFFRFHIAFALLVVFFGLPSLSPAQAIPAEDYGPYNAVFLPDGPGLTKELAPPVPKDRSDINPQ